MFCGGITATLQYMCTQCAHVCAAGSWVIVRAFLRTCVPVRMRVHMHVLVRARIHMCVRAYECLCMCVRVQTCLRVHLRIHVFLFVLAFTSCRRVWCIFICKR